MKLAIVGGGVSGLLAAYWLRNHHDVTLFEANHKLGGHTNTVEVDLGDRTEHVDTGFIVYNEANYPLFARALEELGVASQPSEMSFSVSCATHDFEYRGNGLSLWAQPTNALRPSHARFLSDIVSFNRSARSLLGSGADPGGLAGFVASGRWGPQLWEHYVLPLGSAIWSANPVSFGAMPAKAFARFLDNHGWLRLKRRPQWRTVSGGAANYVEQIARRLGRRARTAAQVLQVRRDELGVELVTPAGPERFDGVVLAVHSDQALGMLESPTAAEREVLGSIAYQPNVATLHTDRRMLPRCRRAWASWNAYVPEAPSSKVKVTYWMNCLQRFSSSEPLCVSLNREQEVDPEKVLGRWAYSHPVLDAKALAAQGRWAELQGHRRTWYCGAYWGYGFHEDGASSAARVARALGAPVSSFGSAGK
jgi:predicted NAD/FAD-binding protein